MTPHRTAGPAWDSGRRVGGLGDGGTGPVMSASTRDLTGAQSAGTTAPTFDRDASVRRRTGWSRRRVSAAVSVTRCGHERVASEQPLADEVEFFAALGSRRDVPAGVTLVPRGRPMHEVYLVESGAVAVLDDRGDRRPILAFALPREVCCAVPALLRQAVPWDAVAVTDAAVLAVPADVFTSVVRERWVDRWTTRTLTWLAEVGSRVAELDEPDSAAQVAALLLRSGGEFSMELCHRTIADLLDLDDSTMREVLSRLEMLRAVRLSGRHISVAQPERLRDVVGIPRPS
jgi:CRP-like cAMP-binding protein